ncbi:MAG: glycosyltransferase family 2 protein [Tangfeifania sp.]
MPPEVSVILPFYNAESTLLAAIESIVQQTFRDFELLLIDNNSSDKSIAIAQNFTEKDTRVKLLQERKPGVAHAMNCGLESSRGQFIARMDADDISLPERLEKQVSYLKTNPGIGLAGCDVKYIPHENNTAGFQRFVEWVNSFHLPVEIARNRFVEIPVVNPTIMFRREIFEKWGGCLQGNFPEDYEMQLRYLEAGVKMAKLPEPLLEWHDYPTRLTRTDDRYSTEAFFRTKAGYFKKWSEKHNRFHPEIRVWGAGRKTRQRARLLENEGLKIQGFIDIVKNKTTEKKTLHFTEIPPPGQLFIVPMVTKRGARKLIKDYLLGGGYDEGKDFMMMG